MRSDRPASGEWRRTGRALLNSWRRPLKYGITLILAVCLNFFLPRVMPGDPLALLAGNAVRQMGAEKIAALRAVYGLDEPLGQQFLVYLGQLLRGGAPGLSTAGVPSWGRARRTSGVRPAASVIETNGIRITAPCRRRLRKRRGQRARRTQPGLRRR